MQLRSDKHSPPGFRVPKPAVTCAVWSTLIVWCYRQCPLAVTNASCGRDIFASVIHLRTAAPNIKSNLQSQRVKKLIWIDLNLFAKSPAEIWLINISKAKILWTRECNKFNKRAYKTMKALPRATTIKNWIHTDFYLLFKTVTPNDPKSCSDQICEASNQF